MLLKGKNYYKILMPGINEATDTDPCLILAGTSLKVVERLRQIGWKRGEIKCRD
jgi:hypothetical protein